MAHSKTRTNDGKITYPPGVKEISDKISKEEMVRRLKVSGHCVLQIAGQWVVALSGGDLHGGPWRLALLGISFKVANGRESCGNRAVRNSGPYCSLESD